MIVRVAHTHRNAVVVFERTESSCTSGIISRTPRAALKCRNAQSVWVRCESAAPSRDIEARFVCWTSPMRAGLLGRLEQLGVRPRLVVRGHAFWAKKAPGKSAISVGCGLSLPVVHSGQRFVREERTFPGRPVSVFVPVVVATDKFRAFNRILMVPWSDVRMLLFNRLPQWMHACRGFG